MAFTKTPQISTYQTVEFPIVKEINSRDYSTDKDVDYLNVVIDPIINKVTGERGFNIQKRDGTSTVWTGGSTEFILDWTVWFTDLVIVTGAGDLKTINLEPGGSFGTVTTRQTNMWGSPPSFVGMSKFKDTAGVMTLLITNGVVIKRISTTYTVSATINDADMPAHFPSLVVMDGYLFVMAESTGAIHNSNLDDPNTWTAGDFITADQYTYTKGVGIYLVNNMIAAVTDSGIEFFYNAAVATGSPLQRNQSLAVRVSVIDNTFRKAVTQQGDKLIFIGAERRDQALSGVSLFVAGPGFIERVNLQALNQALEKVNTTLFALSYIKINAAIHPGTGTPLVIVSVYDTSDSGWTNYVVDLETRLLVRWFIGSTDIDHIDFFTSFTTTYGRSLTFIALNNFSTNVSTILLMNPALNQDSGSNFTYTIVTDLEDFDTINRKTMNRLVLVGEKPASSATTSVSWTDDDYQTYNSAVSVDMYQDLPSITRLGQFRRRALKLTGTHSQPFSLSRIEVDINKGQT